MNERPEQIFRGRLEFYLWKLFSLFVAGLIVAFTLCLPLLILFNVDTANATGPNAIGASILGLICFGYFGLRIVGNLLLTSPEIGVSQHYLWFRHLGVWQAIPWRTITTIDTRQQVTGGIYLYSDHLPVYHHWTTADFWLHPRLRLSQPTLKPGKTLFISPLLNNYYELTLLLSAMQKKVRPADSKSKREKRRRATA